MRGHEVRRPQADVSVLMAYAVRELITGRAPGTPVTLTLRQGAEQRTVAGTPAKRPDNAA